MTKGTESKPEAVESTSVRVSSLTRQAHTVIAKDGMHSVFIPSEGFITLKLDEIGPEFSRFERMGLITVQR